MIRARPAKHRGPALLVVAALAGACGPRDAPPADANDIDAPAMAEAARGELLHAWRGYERYAWGHDELAPLSRSWRDWHDSTLLMTPVDALDTLILAGLDEQAAKARELVATRLRFDVPLEVQVFEITIRILGGLLSSYQLTGDGRLLDLAEDLGERLLPAFESPTGMPYRYGEADMWTGERTGTHWGALQAFLPGLLALDGDLDRARRLQESGLRMWRLHGIEPDGIDYREMEVVDPGYPLRPEIVESAYVLHELTGDPRYREMGRIFFEDLKRHCRTEAGYTVLESVVTKEQGDLMHSFFLAETLKYLYLLFAPEAIDFGQVVFTTEAHPLRRTVTPGATDTGQN